MIKIGAIIESIKAIRFRITDHADEEANNDRISLTEALEMISSGPRVGPRQLLETLKQWC